MTYQNKFVVAVKSNSSILREHDGIVTLPFGLEYSLLLKNLNSLDSQVSVSIDSNDVLDGNSLVIRGNNEMELHGFMKGNTVKNKFKFIQKTTDIVSHRGDKIDDGIIRIEFKFEKEVYEVVTKHSTHYEPYCEPWCYPWKRKPWGPYVPWTIWEYNPNTYVTGDSIKDSSFTCDSGVSGINDTMDNTQNFNCSTSQLSAPIQDEGITVHGSQANQQLQSAHISDLEFQSHVIIIKLRGTDSGGIEVVKPITVKTKLECPTCDKSNKSNNKFCANCGTSLL